MCRRFRFYYNLFRPVRNRKFKPEKAIEMYEMALKMQNKDPKLTEKIGEAYVQCHLYTKVRFLKKIH